LASLNRCNTGIPVPASWLNSIWHEPSVPNDMFVTSDVSEVATFRYLTELHHVAYLSVIESKSGAHRSTSSPIPLHRFTVQKKQNDPNPNIQRDCEIHEWGSTIVREFPDPNMFFVVFWHLGDLLQLQTLIFSCFEGGHSPQVTTGPAP
jgi:hypothetical protein